MRQLLESYARGRIPEMLASDGSPCGPFTRGLLQRRPIRDGERWYVLKEAAVYGDDPVHAFEVPSPQMVRRPRSDGDSTAGWNKEVRDALRIVGAAPVAKHLNIAERTVRSWTSGERRPENPAEVRRAIVAVATKEGLTIDADQHLQTAEICGQLRDRAEAVQCLASVLVTFLVIHFGSTRALARTLSGDRLTDLEPSLRRWMALGREETRCVVEINDIVARLANFARAELRKTRRRFAITSGSVGDRQLILGYLCIVRGIEKPQRLRNEEVLAVPQVVVVLALVTLLIIVVEGCITAQV